MNVRYHKAIYLFSSLILVSCGQSTIRVLSTPIDAEVQVIDQNGVGASIGKTPLNATDGEIFKNNKHAHLKIIKSGFTDEDIVITKSLVGSDTVVNLQLKKDENIQNVGEQTITQEKVASSIARANGLIQAKQLEEAETTMLNFVEQFPSVSVGHDYLGNIYYLQKKYPKALKYYNRAMNLNPQNPERKVIIERLQNLVSSQTGETP